MSRGVRPRHAIVSELDRTLTELVETHTAEVKDLKRKLATATVKNYELTRQRDTARGKAAEYRSYTMKYRRDLVAARNEIIKLTKEVP